MGLSFTGDLGVKEISPRQQQMYLEEEFALYSRFNQKPRDYKTDPIKEREFGGAGK